MDGLVVGIDVGTGSARAALFDLSGACLSSAAHPIVTWRPRPNFVEQSSEDIWDAVGAAVRDCISQYGGDPSRVIGVSFDATCSLVVLDTLDRPVSVDTEGDPQRNVIVWMDHRAIEETEEINAGDFDVLRFVGGRLSPEMETP